VRREGAVDRPEHAHRRPPAVLHLLENRNDALLRRNLGPESEQEVAALQTEIAALEGDITALRGEASGAGVLGSELKRVLNALKRERLLLAVMVAAELSMAA
jgi:hypothetical protein